MGVLRLWEHLRCGRAIATAKSELSVFDLQHKTMTAFLDQEPIGPRQGLKLGRQLTDFVLSQMPK